MVELTSPSSTGPSEFQRWAWTVAVDHPAFDGHFPMQPILPGVAILAAAIEQMQDHQPTLANLGSRGPWRLESCKWLSMLGPGAACWITATALNRTNHNGAELAAAKIEVHRQSLDAQATLGELVMIATLLQA